MLCGFYNLIDTRCLFYLRYDENGLISAIQNDKHQFENNYNHFTAIGYRGWFLKIYTSAHISEKKKAGEHS